LSSKGDAFVVRALGDCRRKPTSGTGPEYRNTGRVDAEPFAFGVHPVQCRHAVVETGGEWMFRREAVVR